MAGYLLYFPWQKHFLKSTHISGLIEKKGMYFAENLNLKWVNKWVSQPGHNNDHIQHGRGSSTTAFPIDEELYTVADKSNHDYAIKSN